MSTLQVWYLANKISLEPKLKIYEKYLFIIHILFLHFFRLLRILICKIC